jgi:hypothetical protein
MLGCVGKLKIIHDSPDFEFSPHVARGRECASGTVLMRADRALDNVTLAKLSRATSFEPWLI